MSARLPVRPAAPIADGMKLHRRRLRLGGRNHTVITLRPGTDARFSTNYFHDTWHVLSDWRGARLLGRLLWGLAFQRVPGTLVVIDLPFVDPNPFDASPGDPIVLIPSRLTPWSAAAARDLRRRLPLHGPGDGTVRWHTHGLDRLVAAGHKWQRLPTREWMDRVHGMVTFAAADALLRAHAYGVFTLGVGARHGMDYTDLAWQDGEVQVFSDYRARVSAARAARAQVLGGRALTPEAERLLWERGTAIRTAMARSHGAPVRA
ncbi:hypothetical protein Val02_78930 [Virgisporangium aliadipatigenens]|uniref:Uncharacterized protein n=1 Tax=Virgisporangium aliadipatigenens TaxID=741659 RepID=A0A8J3YV08_9ACTN|nr:hypothetical protein [Virgisporangium aliadipatigenens]GIJ51007.1 hypothetical protein Val02_78930 [Virgisporangium aliadipatigenens]